MPSMTITPIAPSGDRPLAGQRVRDDRVDAQARREREWVLSEDAHREGHDSGDQRRSGRYRGRIKTERRRDDVRVQEDDVGHDQERGHAGADFGAQVGASFTEVEVMWRSPPSIEFPSPCRSSVESIRAAEHGGRARRGRQPRMPAMRGSLLGRGLLSPAGGVAGIERPELHLHVLGGRLEPECLLERRRRRRGASAARTRSRRAHHPARGGTTAADPAASRTRGARMRRR